LLEALEATHWNKSKTAEKLHWSRMKIYRKMARYHIADSESCAEPATSS
jgi:DNA-binding NtrC family response regulator